MTYRVDWDGTSGSIVDAADEAYKSPHTPPPPKDAGEEPEQKCSINVQDQLMELNT